MKENDLQGENRVCLSYKPLFYFTKIQLESISVVTDW